ncbi:MAG: peptidylprolyl isomerase [Gammaproteobacteria bacterium]|jgi:peptidyl-prolyl cis-trans isomerase C
MNHRLALPIIAVLAVVAGCDQLPTAGQAETGSDNTVAAAVPGGPVVATVNGTPITRAALDVYITQRSKSTPHKGNDDEDAILNELISLELMRQESISKDLDSKPEVVAALAQQQRTILAGAAISEFMANNAATDEDAKQLYDEQLGKPTTEYNARHILLDTEEEAADVIKMLDDGADFSELAKDKSTGPSGPSGGKLGWFGANQMVKPFSDAAAELEKGEYTKEPVQTQFGWHVIMLDDTRESTPPNFEDVRDRLKVLIANRKLQQHVEEIKSAADIQINE